MEAAQYAGLPTDQGGHALDRSVARAEQALEWAEAFDTRAREQVDAYITESTRLQQETSQYANRLADDFRSASLDALRRSADVLRG